MRVLVTGATGFVGSHVLEALRDYPQLQLVAACRDVNRLAPGYIGEVRGGDLRDKRYVDSLLTGVDVVCHCAAWSSLYGHAQESRTLYLQPSLRVLETAIAKGVRKFINVSTTSAAAPEASADPRSRGINRAYWPHLNNLITIENAMRDYASRTATTMVNLRLGIFAGKRYALGVLPILLPRLKTHLVPFVRQGRTHLPIIDGRDIGQAFALAVLEETLQGYEAFNIVGPEVPTTRQVLDYLHQQYHYPLPHFSVPFPLAYAFAWLMEKLDPLVPWEPLVTRSIIHLLEEVNVSNAQAQQRLGYHPQWHWQTAIDNQLAEMQQRQHKPMSMRSALG